MYQYRTNQSQRSERVKQKSVQSETLKPKPNRSRFPQTKLLVLIVRQIVHGKTRSVFNLIAAQAKPKYQYLNAIDVMSQERVKWAFMEIRRFGSRSAVVQLRVQTERINRRIFLVRLLHKLWAKTARDSLTKIQHYINITSVNQLKIWQCLTHVNKILNKTNQRIFVRKIIKINESAKLNKSKTFQLLQNCDKILMKNKKIAFGKIYGTSSNHKYEEMYKQSQQLRKNFYDFENNKRTLMANQRQNLHNLKQIIDNFAYQKNVKAGEMKRQKAIKMSQTQQQIKKLERDYEIVQNQWKQLQKTVGKMNMILKKRENLNARSAGALIKVHHIYNTLKYQSQPMPSPKSSSLMLKIVLNKQKFSQALSQYNSSRGKIQQFQLTTNITNRNLICLYQNIPLQSIKHSHEYLKAQQQNKVLKLTINALLSYHLLKDQGDLLLKHNNNELESAFQKYLQYLHTQQQQSMYKQTDQLNGSSIGIEMIKISSYTTNNHNNNANTSGRVPSNNTINNRRKSSIVKTSAVSNRSIK